MTIKFGDITINSRLRTIRHGDRIVRFDSGVRFLLLRHLLLGAGNLDQIFDHLYGDRADGGPVQGRNFISVMINQAMPAVARLGLAFHKERICGRVIYTLIPKRQQS